MAGGESVNQNEPGDPLDMIVINQGNGSLSSIPS